jgi:hypothetical protein
MVSGQEYCLVGPVWRRPGFGCGTPSAGAVRYVVKPPFLVPPALIAGRSDAVTGDAGVPHRQAVWVGSTCFRLPGT